MSERSDEQKTKNETKKAKKFRTILKSHSAYISFSEKEYLLAAIFLSNIKKDKTWVLLRPSSRNPEPIKTVPPQPDKLARNGTHMIFTLDKILPGTGTRSVRSERLIIGDDGITVNYDDPKNSKKYKNLNDLLKFYTDLGCEILTVANKPENLYDGSADLIKDPVNNITYAKYKNFEMYEKSNKEKGNEVEDIAEVKIEAEDNAEPGRPFTPMAGMAGKSKQHAESEEPPPSRGSRPH